MKTLTIMAAGLVLAAIAMGNQVGPPALTNVQGRLNDQNGDPVADGNYTMIFSFWDRAVGGSQLWAETLSVPVSGGLFSAVLGQVHGVDPDWLKSVDPDFAPHLQTAVNGELLSTRTRIVSNPYSGQASRVTGDIETGPGEIVFVGIGTTPDLPVGIVFQDTSTGDTIARYSSKNIVFISYQPSPPPDMGVAFNSYTGNTLAKYGPGGAVLTKTGILDPEYLVMDTTGSALARYGRSGAVWVQPQPEPPLPAAAKIGSFGLVLGDVGPNHVRYGPGGIVMTDASGDTTFRVQQSGAMRIEEIQLQEGSSDGRIRGDVMVFTTNGDTTVKLTPGGHLTLGETVTAGGRLTVSGEVEVFTGKVTVAGGDLEVTTGDLTISGGGKVTVASGDLEVTTGDLTLGGNAMMIRGTMAGASTDVPTLTVRRSSLPPAASDVFRVQNNSGSTNYLRVESSGTVSAGGNVSVGGGLTVGGNVSVSSGLSVSGTLSTSTDAGSSTVVAVGQRYRDNAVVAWGRVTGAGSLTNDYGVASAVRNSTGNYTITLDASASLPGNLITTAVAELDAAPTTAAASRLIYVDQAPGASSNSFNLYITNGSFAAADNDFMFMATAR